MDIRIYQHRCHKTNITNYSTTGENLPIIHETQFVNPNDGTHTNSIENFWSNLKAKLKVVRRSQRKMLDGHLDEFVYRYNRKTEGSMFEHMLTY